MLPLLRDREPHHWNLIWGSISFLGRKGRRVSLRIESNTHAVQEEMRACETRGK